jgi:hypothetical protein
MIDTCTYVYPEGRPCRRIPKRGESLCPSHRPRRHAETKDELFERQMFAWGEHLQALPLDQLLETTRQSLARISPLIERRISRPYRAVYARAAMAAGVTAETLEAARARPATLPSSDPASTAHGRTTAPHKTVQERVPSIEELSALCDRLAIMFPPDSSQQNQ